MPDILKSVVIPTVSSAALIGFVVWLCRNWILERLKGAVAYEYAEKLKALEHGYAQQLEKLRAQLQTDSLKSKEELEHDRKIFAKLVSICGEITFRDACTTIAGHQFFDDREYKQVMALEHYGIDDENQFANPELRAAFLKFHKTLAKFTTIVATNFFNVGEDRYMLYPELKNSGDAEERKTYEDARTETRKAGLKTLDAFSEFRQEVKQRLFV